MATVLLKNIGASIEQEESTGSILVNNGTTWLAPDDATADMMRQRDRGGRYQLNSGVPAGPTVSAWYPIQGATGVNKATVQPTITFAAQVIDRWFVRTTAGMYLPAYEANIVLYYGSTTYIPIDFSVDSTGHIITILPQTWLPGTTTMTLKVYGLTHGALTGGYVRSIDQVQVATDQTVTWTTAA